MNTEQIMKTPNFKGEVLQLLAQELIAQMIDMNVSTEGGYETVAKILTKATGDGWNRNEISDMMSSGSQLDFKTFGIIAAGFGYEVNIVLRDMKAYEVSDGK